ncbi:hypothetical protein DOY81_000432 [Sarcophaga bullata]|nr:hypothetical protein DOY81_000432 [Sarcophaga bullata]
MTANHYKFSSTSGLFMVPHLARLVRAVTVTDCNNSTCDPVDEYCSVFDQACMPCSRVCDEQDVRYEKEVCSQQCSDFKKLLPLKNEIHQIQRQQNIILVLLILLLAFVVAHFTWKLLKWLKHKRCFAEIKKKLQRKKDAGTAATQFTNGKHLGGTTITNMNAINDIERVESQTCSATAVDGSEPTVITSCGTRYPSEDITPSTEYSYDNKGLVVTPVHDKPGGRPPFP